MKSYPHVIAKLFYEPLLVTRAQHAAMVRVLESRMAGAGPGVRSDDEDEEDPDELEDGEYVVYEATAVIPVHGTLVPHASDIPASSCGCGLDAVHKMMDMALRDRSVERLVFDFRSPGGAVTGIPELAGRIGSVVSKKTIAVTDSECCSGALWLATQCQHFYATGSSSVGSIGVWCAYLDISRQMENDGVNIQEVSAGKYKTMGAYWKRLTPEEKALVQADVDQIYGQFKEAVNYRREVAEEFMQGQIFDGRHAMDIGLCDGLVEGLDEVIEDWRQD